MPATETADQGLICCIRRHLGGREGGLSRGRGRGDCGVGLVGGMELSLRFGVDPSRVRKILRLALISPRIVEAVLEENEPEIPLETLLDMDLPVGWGEQWRVLTGRLEDESPVQEEIG